MTRKYTIEQLKEAVSSSYSYRQVLSKIGLKEAGGNYDLLKKRISQLNLDISHFTGKGSNKGKSLPRRRHVNDYLLNKFPVQSNKLRLRLISEGYFEHKCYSCGLTKWNGLPIPLELEHKDGNNQNNNLDNLTLLCPNCHAQTSTYRGRNIKTRKLRSVLPVKDSPNLSDSTLEVSP